MAALCVGFLNAPVEERLQLLKQEITGGTVPDKYMRQLEKASCSKRLDLQVNPDTASTVQRSSDGSTIDVDGETFDLVLLCTGVSVNPLSQPLYQQIQHEFDAPTVGNFPQLEPSLCWADDIYVLGCNAALEIGPGCLNLMGAMRGGRLVAESLQDLMWDTKATKALSHGDGNLFAAFMSSGDSSSGDEDSDESD